MVNKNEIAVKDFYNFLELAGAKRINSMQNPLPIVLGTVRQAKAHFRERKIALQNWR
jgi:hypothetical protein